MPKPKDRKPLGKKKKVQLSNDAIFHVASYLKMPGEKRDRKSLQNFRLVSKRFDCIVQSQPHLLPHQLIGNLYIDIVSSYR